MPIASCPVEAETTRYPLVASMNLSTESSCSLSSTQRITFFGRMMGKYAPYFDFSTVRGHTSTSPVAMAFGGSRQLNDGFRKRGRPSLVDRAARITMHG